MITLTEEQIAQGWQISTAHEWMQKLPLNKGILVCVRCKLQTTIGDWKVAPCDEHVVGRNS